jgi:hypothetical protein
MPESFGFSVRKALKFAYASISVIPRNYLCDITPIPVKGRGRARNKGKSGKQKIRKRGGEGKDL